MSITRWTLGAAYLHHAQLILREAQNERATFACPDDRGVILKIASIRNQEPTTILNASTGFDRRKIRENCKSVYREYKTVF